MNRSAKNNDGRPDGDKSPIRSSQHPFACSQTLHPFQMRQYPGRFTLRQVNGGKPFSNIMAAILTYIKTRRFKISIRLMITQRKADRRNPFQTTFDHDSHRTRIMYIRSRIIAMINTTYYQIRFSVEYRVPMPV